MDVAWMEMRGFTVIIEVAINATRFNNFCLFSMPEDYVDFEILKGMYPYIGPLCYRK